MTQPSTYPTGLDLDTILRKIYWDNGTHVVGLSENMIAEAKQALTRWGLEQRIDEIDHLWYSSGHKMFLTNISGKSQSIDQRLTELQANLQGEHS